MMHFAEKHWVLYVKLTYGAELEIPEFSPRQKLVGFCMCQLRGYNAGFASLVLHGTPGIYGHYKPA